ERDERAVGHLEEDVDVRTIFAGRWNAIFLDEVRQRQPEDALVELARFLRIAAAVREMMQAAHRKQAAALRLALAIHVRCPPRPYASCARHSMQLCHTDWSVDRHRCLAAVREVRRQPAEALQKKKAHGSGAPQWQTCCLSSSSTGAGHVP